MAGNKKGGQGKRGPVKSANAKRDVVVKGGSTVKRAQASPGKSTISSKKPGASGGKTPKTIKKINRRKPRSLKSKFNWPLLSALLTMLVLGVCAVLWLLNSSDKQAAQATSTQPGDVVSGAPDSEESSNASTARNIAGYQVENKGKNSPVQKDGHNKSSVRDVQAGQGGAQAATDKRGGRVKNRTGLPSPQPVIPDKASGDTSHGLEQAGDLTDTADALSAPDGASDQKFETSLGSEMEQKTKKIDAYLLEMLNSQGCSGKNIRIFEVERRLRPNNSYHFQKLQVELPVSSGYYANPESFGRDIARGLEAMQVGAELTSPTENHYVLSVNGLVTHEIFLRFIESKAPQPQVTRPTAKSAVIAIVIDDVGESLSAAQSLANLEFPVTFAIWPRASNARKCAEIGRSKGLEIMIHQPMEPLEYPKVKPGPGAVYVGMNPGEVIAEVQENIPLVPYAVGLNNHMGSRFTQNRRGVEAVLAALQGRNLFVLDSLTHGRSVLYDIAREKGFPCQRRDIFLDVSRDKNAILHQLRKTESLALAQGYAIAIGHPLPETLAALKEWENNRNRNLKVVRVQDLLQFDRDVKNN